MTLEPVTGIRTLPRRRHDASPPAFVEPRVAILPRRGEIVLPFPRLRLRVVSVVVAAILAALVLLVVVAGITRGEYPLSIPQVIDVLLGGGKRIERVIVLEWRMGRALVGLLVGLALGAAGAVTQSLARNPLASPDILGISMGASAAGVAMIVVGGGGLTVAGYAIGVPVAAIVGGLGAAALIYVLAWKDGVDPYRLVLIGIGVNAMLVSVVTYLLMVAHIDAAAQATVWLTGSLNGRDWEQFWPLLGAVSVAAVLLAATSFDLGPLRMDDGVARGVGVPVGHARGVMLLAAIILTSATVAAAGPIGFVALVAPQIARILFRSPTPPIVGGALVGALVITAADVVAHTIVPWQLPVGVLTAAIGGPFLLAFLVRANRKVTL